MQVYYDQWKESRTLAVHFLSSISYSYFSEISFKLSYQIDTYIENNTPSLGEF